MIEEVYRIDILMLLFDVWLRLSNKRKGHSWLFFSADDSFDCVDGREKWDFVTIVLVYKMVMLCDEFTHYISFYLISYYASALRFRCCFGYVCFGFFKSKFNLMLDSGWISCVCVLADRIRVLWTIRLARRYSKQLNIGATHWSRCQC